MKHSARVCQAINAHAARRGRRACAMTSWTTSASGACSSIEAGEQAAVDFTRELLQNRKVGRPAFDAATARFGQRGAITLTRLIACYAVLAYNMNAYELEAPAHATEKPLTP